MKEVNTMKKFLSVLLVFAVLFSMSAIHVLANETLLFSGDSSAVNSGGGSGGVDGGGGGGVSVVVSAPLKEYNVSGTIYLPSGVTAPKGGLKIYGGFGGVSYSEIKLASVPSDEYIEEEPTVNYEGVKIIATIPQGQNYVNYSATCTMSSSYDGIYGKFWIYDNVTLGNRTLSNKQTLSAPVNLKAGIYEYSNINCTLNFATTATPYSITCDDALSSESIDTDVYVIADDGYDKYISRTRYTGNSPVNGVINIEDSGNYTLYYYIPSSTAMNLQKLDKGLFNIGILNNESINTITLKSQLYITGEISLPNGYIADKDIKIIIDSDCSEVEVTIPQGSDYTSYIVGAFEKERDFLRITVGDDYLVSGYVGYDNSLEQYKHYFWYDDIDVENFDIQLGEQYIIKGQITLPTGVEMTENTYFNVTVTAKDMLTGYESEDEVKIFSDEETSEYKISIPKTEANGAFIISYDYGSFSSVNLPTNAASPLKYFKSSGTSSGGGGGHGSSGSIVMVNGGISYTRENPDGLLYNYKLYITNNGVALLDEDAKEYRFSNKDLVKNITLAKSDDAMGIIAGYFKNYVKADLYTTVKVALYDENNNLIEQKFIDDSGNYFFSNLNQGSYKIGFWYNDKQYYYNNKHLVATLSDADIIALSENSLFSNHNDVYLDNIFDANIKLNFANIVIDDNYYAMLPITIYDPYGNAWINADSDTIIRANISSFYIGVGDYYVSEFVKGKNIFTITGLVDDIDKAYLFNSEYYDTLSAAFWNTGNTFNVEAETKLYKSPITSTKYAVSDKKLNITVSVKNSVNDCKIIVVAYDEIGHILGICQKDGIYNKYEYNFSIDYSSSIHKIKTMVWSSMQTMQPLGVAEEIIVPSDDIYNESLKRIANVCFITNNSTFYVNGKEYGIDVPPIQDNGVIYIPLRAMSEALGCSVYWDYETERITFNLNDTTCVVQVGNIIAYLEYGNGDTDEIILSACPIKVNDRVLVPCADISELFDFEVYIGENNEFVAMFDTLSKKNKYAYDNRLLNIEKVDISALNNSITRSEMASLLVELYEKSTNTTVIPIDFPFTDEEYQNAIDEDVAKIYTLGIMNGYEDMKFHPDWNLTNAEIIKGIYGTVMKVNSKLPDKYLTVPEYDSIGSDSAYWFTNYLYSAKRLGLLDGVCYDSIEINNNAIRKDVIGIIANAFYQLSKPLGFYDEVFENWKYTNDSSNIAIIEKDGETYLEGGMVSTIGWCGHCSEVVNSIEFKCDSYSKYIWLEDRRTGRILTENIPVYEIDNNLYIKYSDFESIIKPQIDIILDENGIQK